MSFDPYGRPTLTYERDRSRVVPSVNGGPLGWRGFLRVGDRSWPTIENAEARAIPAGRCFGRVSYRADGERPCIWLHWGDPDGGEEHQVHAANEASELRGCIAPGMGEMETGVIYSRQALGEIFDALAVAATGEAAGFDPLGDIPLGLAVIVEVREVGKNGKPRGILSALSWLPGIGRLAR